MGGDYSPEHYFIARFSEQVGIQVFALEISFPRDYFNMSLLLVCAATIIHLEPGSGITQRI